VLRSPAVAALIGRRDELAKLSRLLTPNGPVAVVVSGASGVGKSRMLAEVAARVGHTGFAIERIYGSPAVARVPLGAVAHLIPAQPAEDLPTLFRLARAELQRIGEGRTLLLVVDDFHHLDDGSAALIHHLAAHGHARVVAATRHGQAGAQKLDDLWNLERVERIELQPLAREHTDELVESLLEGPADEALTQAVWVLSRGHPLYVSIALEEARGRGLVTRSNGGQWGLSGQLSSARLDQLIRLRLHGLPTAAREAMEIVAAAAPLHQDLASRVVGREALESLHRHGLIAVQDVHGEPHLTAAHPLYADSLLNAMSSGRRRRITSQLADHILSEPRWSYGDPLREAIWILEAGRAIDLGLGARAAAEALRRGDYPMTEKLARAVIAVAPADVGTRIALGRALSYQGRGAEAEEHLAATEPTNTEQITALALTRAHNLGFLLGRADDAANLLNEIARSLDARDRWQLDADRALYRAIAGEFTATSEAAEAVLASREARGPGKVTAYVNLTLARAMTGRLDDFDVTAEAGLKAAAEHVAELPFAVDQIALNQASAWSTAGRLEDAESRCRERIETSRREGGLNPLATAWLGVTVGMQGRLIEAIDTQRAALEMFEIADPFRLRSQAQGLLTMHQAQAGQLPPGVDELIDQAFQEARGETRLAVWLGRAQAWVAAARDDLNRSAELAAETGLEAISHDHVAWGIWALHDAVRIGMPELVVDEIDDAVARTSGAPLLEAMRDHALSLSVGDLAGLHDVAKRFAGFGSPLLAVEAAAQGAALGDEIDHRRSAVLATVWRRACPDAATPALRDIADVLTQREVDVARLAATGESSRAIADRFFLSVRTVDNHLHSVYRKLELTGREELAVVLGPTPSSPRWANE